MTRKRTLGLAVCLALSSAALVPGGHLSAQALGSAFTYQGQLKDSGQPASGLYDLQVCLFDTPSNPVALACAPDFNDVPVESGLFAITLDFGSAPFVGQQRWLELRVRPGASGGSYTILAPRQLIRPAPEALRANVSAAAPWSGLTGMPAGFADGIDNDSGGTVTSITATGGLSGGTITGSGTIGIANGGVGPTQIATGAVGSAQLAAGAVGTTQINIAQVQARITGTCTVGEYFRGVNADGSVACEPVPGVPRITTVDNTGNPVGYYTSIAIGADGLPVISYHDSFAGALKIAKCADGACAGATTITIVDEPANTVGSHTAIAIGADGLPVVSYHDGVAGALKVAKCGNAACTGAATITTVDDPTNVVGRYTSIAVGTDGLPVISYSDITSGTLKVAKCANSACTGTATITIVDNPANLVGEYSSIAFGADGLPVIGYMDNTSGALKVAKCVNAACTGAATITTVDDPTNVVGPYTSIAVGTDGLPVISYHDLTAGTLKVASCANAACTGAATVTTVDDPINDVGEYTAIAIGTDGLPVISYWDRTAGALKIAKCTDANCAGAATITTVDNPANSVGEHTDIAVGADGLPVISYFDFSARTLKVAKCGTRSCQ